MLEEAVIVSLVILVFLFHFRSALIAIVTLPIAVLVVFHPDVLVWRQLQHHVAGWARAGDRRVSGCGDRHGRKRLSPTLRAPRMRSQVSEPERRLVLIDAAKQVGPALFFSLLIIVVSFLPVFLLEAQEGRMFRPLAWTKTLAVASSSILAITLVPVLMVLLIRGRLRPERSNPVSRITQAIYLPVLRFCLRWRKLTIALNLLFLVATLPLAFRLGSQFMPALFEGSSLYMPTALPGIAIEQAKTLLKEQDRILRTFPEVQSVFGTVGRSDSATDNAPLDMYDTTVMLKPREQWPQGMTYEKLIQEMDAKLQFPGLSNTWTMPVENRLDMALTGIKTPLGLKVQGPNVEGIEQLASRMQNLLSTLPQVRSVFSERVSQGFYINVEPDRAEAARYGLTVADIQQPWHPALAARILPRTWKGGSATRSMCGMRGTSATISRRCAACWWRRLRARRFRSAKWPAFPFHAAPP